MVLLDKVESPVTIESVAARACGMTDDNRKAREIMVRWLKGHPDQFEALKWDLVRAGCELAVHHVRKAGNRIAVGRSPAFGKGVETASKIDGRAFAWSRRSRGDGVYLLMERPFHGLPIGDCRRGDLLDRALHQEATGHGALVWSLFMRTLAAGLKGRQTVRQRYGEEDLGRIYGESEEKVKGERAGPNTR